MDLRDFASAVRRRWYLAAVALLLAVGAGFGAMAAAGAKNSAVGVMVLIPPRSTVQDAARTSSFAPPNPLLYLGNLGQARDVLLRAAASQEVAAAVEASAPGATYAVTNDPQSPGPLVIISTSSKSPGPAVAALEVLETRLPIELKALQERLGIGPSDGITMLQLTSDKTPEIDRKSQVQMGAVGGAVTLVAGLLVLALLDARMIARSARRQSGSPPDLQQSESDA